jgi:hypothetical protein
MKPKISIIILSIFLLIAPSCISLFFIEPVPSDVKNYNSIPKPLWGEWTKEDETHIINQSIWIKQRTDSTGLTKTNIEFELSDSLIIRKVGKYHFINTLEENGYWCLYLGFKEKDLFFIRALSAEDTLIFGNSLDIIADKTGDKNDYFYNKPITKKQMKKFIKNGGFTDTLIVFDIRNRKVLD